MKTKLRAGPALFVAAFFLLCLIPSVGMLLLPAQDAVGNERLASFPLLFDADGEPNEAFLSELSTYIGDHIAFRHEMITLNSKLNSTLFSVVTNEDVVQGRDGWLYYSDTLPDYQGTERMSARQCYAAGKTLQLLQEYCEGQGAAFLFTIAPNKNSLYPEYMPGRYVSSEEEGNAVRLVSVLEQLEVNYADLFAPILAQEEVLYYRTDSHWNDRGAALAGDVLCEALGRRTEPFYPGPYAMTGTHRGDLYEMAYPAGTLLEENAVFERAFTFEYAEGYRSPEDITIRTSSSAASGSLLMFRDSFGNALHPFLAEAFGSACFSRAMPYNMTYLEREGADTVVIELVERNLNWLNTRPPLVPAPERAVEFPAASEAISARAAVSTSNSMAGYTQLAGALDCPAIDADSPVYLRVNGGAVYEATPAGTGEVPFTAFVPEEEVTQAELCVRVGGVWTACRLELSAG